MVFNKIAINQYKVIISPVLVPGATVGHRAHNPSVWGSIPHYREILI